MTEQTVVQNVTGDYNIFSGTGDVYVYKTTAPLSPTDARKRRDLTILLNRVKEFWIDGVLKNSLHNVVLLELGKEIKEDAVAQNINPLGQVLELPDKPSIELSPDTKIVDVFDQLNRGLLILGEPGSGKTITLLQLTSELISRVEIDDTFSQSIPVVFSLSSWSKSQSLTDWMVEQLLAIYQIPRKISRRWLEDNRLLPMLDGLDEVKNEYQADCVEEINRVGEDFGLAGLVVCSRIEEYTNLPVRLKLKGAIRLLPLTEKQVERYLSEAGDELAALQETIQKDEVLKELAESPLTLGIMTLAYEGMSAQELTGQALDTIEKRRSNLFETYIERMFKRKGDKSPYDNELTKQSLSWLAWNIQRHNQEVFLIERMQPSWLLSNLQQWIYIIVSRLVSSLIIGFAIYLLMGNLMPDLLSGITGGIVTILAIDLRLLWSRHYVSPWPPVKRSLPWSIINISIYGLSVMLSVGIVLYVYWNVRLGKASELLSLGTTLFTISQAMIVGLLFVILFGLRTHGQDIKTTEKLSWSWVLATQGARRGVFVGLLVGLIVGLVVEPIRHYIFISLVSIMAEQDPNLRELAEFSREISPLTIVCLGVPLFGVLGGIIFGMVGGLFGGLHGSVVQTKTRPNEGIRLTARNAVITALLLGFPTGLIIGLIGGQDLSDVLRAGLMVGLLVSLWYGGLDIIQHYTLRFILLIQGHTPRNYVRFLDYSTNLIFLQKVGGGYRFIHRLLLEHFAVMEPDTMEK